MTRQNWPLPSRPCLASRNSESTCRSGQRATPEATTADCIDGIRLVLTATEAVLTPLEMARAFALGVEAGHAAYLARPMEPRDMAVPSTPVIGKAALGD